MFDNKSYKEISQIAKIPEEMLKTVTYANNIDDDTFENTLNILFMDRNIIPENPEVKGIKFYVQNSPVYNVEDATSFIENQSKETFANLYLNNFGIRNQESNYLYKLNIVCLEYNDTDERTKIIVDAITETMSNKHKNFKLIKVIDNAIKSANKKASALVYSNSENNSTFCVLTGIRPYENKLYNYHAVQTFIPYIFPEAFKEKPLTDLEKELLKSLSFKEGDQQKYINIINQIINDQDFNKKIILEKFGKIETQFIEDVIRRLEDQYQSYTQDIERYRETIQKLLSDKTDIEDRLCGYKLHKENANEGEFANYLINNTNVEYIGESSSRRNSMVYSTLNNYLTAFNEDSAEDIINNANSYLYSWIDDYGDVEFNKDVLKEFYNRVFIDKTLKIRTYGLFIMDVKNAYCRVFDTNEYLTNSRTITWRSLSTQYLALPNPHHYFFRCLGGNENLLDERMQAQNLVGAIDMSVFATKWINVNESTTAMRWARTMTSTSGEFYNLKCIETKDGEIISAKEALELINKEMTDNGETDNA